MIGRALDSNNDLIFERGSIKLVDEGAQLVQHVRSRLLMYRGEWFLDTNAGVPYLEEIFTKPVNLANIESIFKGIILNTEGVLRLLSFSMTYDGGSERRLNVFFSAESIYGVINNEEVTLNV